MTKSTATVSTAGQMAEFIAGSGLKASSMASEFIQLKVPILSMAYGKTAKELSGLTRRR
jgi:hypothetical protein